MVPPGDIIRYNQEEDEGLSIKVGCGLHFRSGIEVGTDCGLFVGITTDDLVDFIGLLMTFQRNERGPNLCRKKTSFPNKACAWIAQNRWMVNSTPVASTIHSPKVRCVHPCAPMCTHLLVAFSLSPWKTPTTCRITIPRESGGRGEHKAKWLSFESIA